VTYAHGNCGSGSETGHDFLGMACLCSVMSGSSFEKTQKLIVMQLLELGFLTSSFWHISSSWTRMASLSLARPCNLAFSQYGRLKVTGLVVA
jgi:hypothetical protein